MDMANIAKRIDYRMALLGAGALAFSLLGYDWGLPSEAAINRLFSDNRAAVTAEMKQVTDRIGIDTNQQIHNRESSPRDAIYRTDLASFSATENREELLRIYRHFFLWSKVGDVGVVFGALSSMSPARLDFNPHVYEWGGALLYPIALMVKIADIAGVINLQPGVNHYIDHPGDFCAMTRIARLFVVLMNVACVLLIYRAGSAWKNPNVGMIAAVLYLLMPSPLSMAREVKPHGVGVVWVVVSFSAALRYFSSAERKHLIYSALASGLAMGTAVNYGITFVFPCVAVALGPSRAKIRDAAAAALAHLCAFTATNPYFFFNLDTVRKEFAYLQSLYNGAVPSWTHGLSGIFVHSITPVITAVLVPSSIWYLRSRDPGRVKTLVFSGVCAYMIMLFATTKGSFNPRFTIFLYPFIALISAWGLWELRARFRAAGTILLAAVIGFMGVQGAYFAKLYIDESREKTTIAEAGHWLSALPPGTSIGTPDLPISPNQFPYMPLINYTIVTISDVRNLPRQAGEELPDYIVTTGPGPDDERYVLDRSFAPRSRLFPYFGVPYNHTANLGLNVRVFKKRHP